MELKESIFWFIAKNAKSSLVNHWWSIEGSSWLSCKAFYFYLIVKVLQYSISTESKSSGMTSYLIYCIPGMEMTLLYKISHYELGEYTLQPSCFYNPIVNAWPPGHLRPTKSCGSGLGLWQDRHFRLLSSCLRPACIALPPNNVINRQKAIGKIKFPYPSVNRRPIPQSTVSSEIEE